MRQQPSGARPLPYPDPPLTDGVLVLRKWTYEDLRCVEEASWDPTIRAGTSVPANFTREEGRAWIERQWQRNEDGRGISLAITHGSSSEACGVVVLMLKQPETFEVGYWVIERARRKRFASRGVGLAVRYALTNAGVPRVEALVEPDNSPSQRVLEAIGFRREGYLRSYLVFADRRADALIYSLLPSDLN